MTPRPRRHFTCILCGWEGWRVYKPEKCPTLAIRERRGLPLGSHYIEEIEERRLS